MAEGIQPQGPQRQWSFQSEIMLALSRTRRCQEVHLWKAPKVKSCLSHLGKKMPLQKHPIPGQKICLHIEVGRNVCWKKSNTVLVSQTQYLAGQSGRKRRHCTPLITQVHLSSTVIQIARQQPYQRGRRPSYGAWWQQPEVPARQYEPYTRNLTRHH